MKKFILELHRYAPELNKAIFDNGATMDAGNATTIRDFKRANFAPVKPGRYCRIEYINDSNPSLNRIYQGYTTGYKAIRGVLHALRNRHNVPGGQFNISIKYIGA